MVWWIGLFLSGAVVSLCHLLIIIHAFRHHTQKALFCLWVPVYLPIYAIVDYESPNKALVLLGYFGGAVIAILAFLQLTAS
jgi:hypothetical protein